MTEAKPFVLHHHVPFPDYLRWPIVSQSVLKEGRASMAHMKAAMDRELEKKVTDDMLLGSALHTCFLEPEYAAERIAIWRGPRRYGAEWDGFQDEHENKIILTVGLHVRLIGMIQALRKHPFVREWSSKIEHVEISATGDVFGVPMKGRCDALTTDPLVDLKKCRSADAGSFYRTSKTFGYHIQAAAYLELFQRERFVFLAVEGTKPYDVVPYELSPGLIRRGQRQCKRLLEQYQECVASGIWPGRSDQVVQLESPDWDQDDDGEGITIGGGAAFQDEEETDSAY